MSDKRDELPRDLRALCGGTVEGEDGFPRTLPFPVQSYSNICEARRSLEHAIDDPEISMEDVAPLRAELELVKRLQAELEQRNLNHFEPRPPASNPTDEAHQWPQIDHGAKSKVQKLIEDMKAGRYDRPKQSKTLQAVFSAFAFFKKNGRMPSHGELKSLGYNDQQVTDAGKWLEMQADPNPDEESLFLPLHRPKRGRPPKKM